MSKPKSGKKAARPTTGKSSPRASLVAALIILGLLAVSILIPVGLALRSAGAADEYVYYGNKIDPRDAYDFQLSDQDGKPFRLSELRGSVVLLTFGFTHCANVCPTTLGNLAAMDRKLPPEVRSKVKVAFVSVDPERDTPQVLKDYVPFFDASFTGLTGSKSSVATAAKGFGVSYQKVAGPDPSDYSVDHSAYTYLVDPRGRLYVIYRFEQMNNTARIVEDIEHVLETTKM